MKRLLTLFIFFAISSFQQASAASIPTASSSRVGTVIEGAIISKTISQGVAKTDARVFATSSAIGALTSILTPACYTVGWLSMGACMVGNALLPIFVALAINSTTQIKTADEGVSIYRAQVVGSSTAPPATYEALIEAMGYQSEYVYNYEASGQQMAQHFKTTIGGASHETIVGWNQMYIMQVSNYLGSGLPIWVHLYQMDYVAGPLTFPPTTPSEAAPNIPQADLTKLVSPEKLAESANQAWEAAAKQPDYQGQPFNPADPITAADISNALAKLSASERPTVADFLSPQLPGNVNPETGGSTGETPITNVTVDFGPDPGIAEPVLEEAPTGISIVQPLLDQLNPFRNFNLPPHANQCPVAIIEFSIYSRSFSGRIDSHCTLWEQNASLLAGVMTAFWLLSATFIFLRA